MRGTCLWTSGDTFFWFECQSKTGFKELVGKYSLFFHFLEKFVQKQH